MRNPENYPGFVAFVPVAVEGSSSSSNNIRGVTISIPDEEIMKENERILRKAVGKGRYVSFCFNLQRLHYLIGCLLSDYQQLNTPLPFTCRHHEHVLSNNDDNNLRQTTPHKKIRSSVKWRGRSNSKSIEPCVGDMVREWIPSVKLVGLQNRLGISCCHPNENLLSRN